jgi:methionine-S-sulfoxide reductase
MMPSKDFRIRVRFMMTLWGICLALVLGCDRTTPVEDPSLSSHATDASSVESPAAAPKAALPSEPGSSSAVAGPDEPRSRSEDLGLAGRDVEVVVLAGGCFWGMQEILRSIPGVLDTEVGYAGGAPQTATYEQVKQGTTGHAESVRITFDPARISFEALLRDWFFKMHDPTTVNRQGNDRGSQYRSAIFVSNEHQKQIALAVKEQVNRSGAWDEPVVTEVTTLSSFGPAEEYHQDYLQKHPDGYTCHYLREVTY